MSSESAAERGEWRTDRAPYQRAIMDSLSPNHPCGQVVLMSGAQLGKTKEYVRIARSQLAANLRGRGAPRRRRRTRVRG